MELDAYKEMYALEDVHWWFRGRREVIRALLQRTELPAKVRLLDAGCGTGRNLVEFGPLGAAAGVDPSSDAVEFCHHRGLGDVRQAGIEALPFGPNEFELLLACDVLEHVEDDRGALIELRRVASVGGLLLITVPAYQWLWTEHDVQLHHVRRYTMRTLRAGIHQAGWDVVQATYFNSIALPLVALARLAERRSSRHGHTDLDRTPEVLNGVLALPMRFEAWMIRHGARLPAGVSIGVLCRNPDSSHDDTGSGSS
jgi:SAM-dependent methyltransferase